MTIKNARTEKFFNTTCRSWQAVTGKRKNDKSCLTLPDFFIRESSLHPGVTYNIGCIRRGMNEKDTHYQNGI
jgi:hypothetical protein